MEFARILALGFIVALSACEQEPLPPSAPLEKHSELASAREWSVLQAAELAGRAETERKPFLIVRGAGGSDLNVVGIPLKLQSTGYTWVIANPTSEPAVKQMPSAEFALTQNQYDGICASVEVHPAVRRFLQSHTRSN
jgi:hypothetical protein